LHRFKKGSRNVHPGGKLEKFVTKGEGVRNYLWDDLPKKEELRRKLTTLEILKGLHFDE
jgi:hypothetical protein